MSTRLKEIMEKHNVDIDGAIEILERETEVMKFLCNYTNPYGKVCH